MSFINSLDMNRSPDLSRTIYVSNYPQLSVIARCILALIQTHPSTDFYTRVFVGIPNTLYATIHSKYNVYFRITYVASCALGFINPKFSYLAWVPIMLFYHWKYPENRSFSSVIKLSACILANTTDNRRLKSLCLISYLGFSVYNVFAAPLKSNPLWNEYSYPVQILYKATNAAIACLATRQLYQMAKGLR